jgi:hypothetical protein
MDTHLDLRICVSTRSAIVLYMVMINMEYHTNSYVPHLSYEIYMAFSTQVSITRSYTL